MVRAIALASLFFLAACGQSPLARNRAVADEVLRQSGAPDFENASAADRAAVRHLPSGLTCRLPRDGAFDMGVFPASARNAGAHCSTADGQTAASFIVTRFGTSLSLDGAFAQALESTAGQAQATPWDGQPSAADRAPPEGLPHFRIARFRAMINGAPAYLRVAVAEREGWFLQQIVTAPFEQAEAVEANAGEAWRVALDEFRPPGGG